MSTQFRFEGGQELVEKDDGIRGGGDGAVEIHERRKRTLRGNVVIRKYGLDAAGRPHAGERVLHVNLPDHSDFKTKSLQELGVRIGLVYRVAQGLPPGTQAIQDCLQAREGFQGQNAFEMLLRRFVAHVERRVGHEISDGSGGRHGRQRGVRRADELR